jgi:hypothetical protein
MSTSEETMVVVSIITHRHGEDVSVYWNEQDAVKAAAEYAREWWREAGFEFDAPEDDQECIDVYFDHREDEFLETRLEVVR